MLLLCKAISNKARASWGALPRGPLTRNLPWTQVVARPLASLERKPQLRPCMICMSLSIANENDVCRQSQEVQKRQRYGAKAPVESIEDHYRVNHFLLYIDHRRHIYTFAISPRPESHFLRLCELEMLYVHRNDTVGQVNPEAVLKRWDSRGNRKIHLAFTD